jgi:hypothetical protein
MTKQIYLMTKRFFGNRATEDFTETLIAVADSYKQAKVLAGQCARDIEKAYVKNGTFPGYTVLCIQSLALNEYDPNKAKAEVINTDYYGARNEAIVYEIDKDKDILEISKYADYSGMAVSRVEVTQDGVETQWPF